jgi:hypothetical protein
MLGPRGNTRQVQARPLDASLANKRRVPRSDFLGELCVLAVSVLLLFRDDLVFDLVVSRLGDDLLSHQVGLLCIRTPVDDLL